MKHLVNYKLIFAAAMGMAFAALTAHAQLNLNLDQVGTFGPPTGSTTNYSVTNNGSMNTEEVIKTGNPLGHEFQITYDPVHGVLPPLADFQSVIVANLVFKSTLTNGVFNSAYFNTLPAVIDFDFDHDGITDLTETYTIALSPVGSNAINYAITPTNNLGSVTINGAKYTYLMGVVNDDGVLLGSSETTASIKFAFAAAPVPEPSTYALLGVATLAGITWLRRRRTQLGVSA